MMKSYFLAVVVALSLLVITSTVFADTSSGSVNAKLTNPIKYDTIEDLFSAIINDVLLPIGSILAVIAFVWSGFLFVTAQGNETKLETAKRALLYTAIGTAILLGAWVIKNVITGTISSITS